MNNFAYPATLTPDPESGGFVIIFRYLPEAITQGEDLSDALEQAADCLEEAIAGRISDNEVIPQPSSAQKEEYLIHLPAQTAIKAALYNTMRSTPLTKLELAKRLNCDETEIDCLLDPHQASKWPSIENALQALGHQVVIDIIPLTRTTRLEYR
jgi:antitoxin HicB